jgi:iron-sulfur cluster assembly protein
MIQITEMALAKIQDIIKKKNIQDNYALRIGIKGGSCSQNFFIGFDRQKEDDELLVIEHLKIVINKKQLMYLINIQLDFEEKENGFIFIQPHTNFM